MIACSANEICMGKHSFLGPTDPQFVLPTHIGPRQMAAQAALQQFEITKAGLTKQSDSLACNLLISQLGPDLIAQCENAVEMSRMLGGNWLRNYMFMEQHNRVQLSYRISNWLADHSKIKSHSRHLPRKMLIEKRFGGQGIGEGLKFICISCGNDINLYVQSWQDCQKSIRKGIH